MTFKITNSRNKETLVKAESWLDLLHSISRDTVKIERIIEADKEATNESMGYISI